MDYSAEFSLKSEITLDRIQEMNKEQTALLLKRISDTNVLCVSLTFRCLCIQKGFIMEKKTTGFGLSAYQPADTTISISAVKWLGLSGACLVISDMVNQKIFTVLPYFYVTFQQHSDTPISLFIVHTDTAEGKRLPLCIYPSY